MIKKGIMFDLLLIIVKWELKKDEVIDEIVYYVFEVMMVMEGKVQEMIGKESCIYLVICLIFFLDKFSEDILFIYDDYIVEIRIYYVFDFGKIYCLIDQCMFEKENWIKEWIREMVVFNFCFLLMVVKEDMVVGNYFYFFRVNDGYDVSWILNEVVLNEYK